MDKINERIPSADQGADGVIQPEDFVCVGNLIKSLI